MKNSFSFPRFIQYAQAVARSERKGILLKGGGFILFVAMIYFLANLGNIFGYNLTGPDYSTNILAPRFMVMMAAFFLILFNLSGSFKRFHKRNLSVSSLMLPAARSEKFLLPLITNLILVPVFFFLVIYVFDLACSWALDFDHPFRFWSWLKLDGSTMEEKHMAIWFLCLLSTGTFASLCFYFLGSVFFRRYSFLLTLVAQNVISIPVFIGFNLLGHFVLKDVILTPEEGRRLMEQVLPCGVAVNVLLIAGMIFAAWTLFKNLKVAK